MVLDHALVVRGGGRVDQPADARDERELGERARLFPEPDVEGVPDELLAFACARILVDEFGPLPIFGHTVDGNRNGHTAVAEQFGKTTKFKTPKVESTGSGGGLKLFCKGVGADTPDITNSSRAIKQSEYDDCQKNGVTEIVEVLIGYDGIALATASSTA